MNFEEIKSKIDFTQINQLRLKNNKIIHNRMSIILILNLMIYIGIVIYVWPFLSFFPALLIPFLIVVFLVAILHRIFIHKYELEFKKSFENNVIEIIFHALQYKIELKVDEKMKSREFGEGKIISNYNVFNAEELFEGTIENIPIKFSEIKIETKSRYSRQTHLRGFYSQFQYDLNPDLVIDVIKDESRDNSMLQKLNFKRDKLVRVDDLEFEKFYVIYTNQEDLTKKIMSQTLIQNLNELSIKLGSKLYFSIRKGKAHIAYNDEVNYFEIDFNKTSEELAEIFYLDIQKIHSNMVLIKNFLDENVVRELKFN